MAATVPTAAEAAAVAEAEAVRPVKLTVALPLQAVNEIESMATSRSKTRTQVLREAIALKAFVERERTAGNRLLVQEPSGATREIVFTD